MKMELSDLPLLVKYKMWWVISTMDLPKAFFRKYIHNITLWATVSKDGIEKTKLEKCQLLFYHDSSYLYILYHQRDIWRKMGIHTVTVTMYC